MNSDGEALDAPVARPATGIGVRSGAGFVLARTAVHVFQLLSTLVVARLLAPTDYGVAASAALLTSFAEVIATAGLGRAIVHKEKIEKRDLAEIFSFSLALAIAIYLAVVALAVPLGIRLAVPQFASFVQMAALVLLLAPIQGVATALLERQLRFNAMTIVLTTTGLTQAVLALSLAWLGLGYWALGISALAGGVLQTGLLLRVSGWRPSLALPSARLKPLLLYGSTIAASGLVWNAYRQADVAVIIATLSPAKLGFYWFALQIVSLPNEKLSTALNLLAFPVYCRLQEDVPRMQRWLWRMMLLVAAVAAPVLAGLALVAEDAVPLLLGEKWRPAVLPLQLLAPVGAMMCVSTLLAPFANARGRPDLPLKMVTVSAIIFPIAFYAGGRVGDLAGVCIAWLVVFPAIFAINLRVNAHLTGLGPLALLRRLLPILASTLAMALVVLAVRDAVADWPVASRLAISVVAGAIAYVAAIAAFGRTTVIPEAAALLRGLRNG